MERYLVELTGHQLERLSIFVRDAIEAAGDENKPELEHLLLELLSAVHDMLCARVCVRARESSESRVARTLVAANISSARCASVPKMPALEDGRRSAT